MPTNVYQLERNDIKYFFIRILLCTYLVCIVHQAVKYLVDRAVRV